MSMRSVALLAVAACRRCGLRFNHEARRDEHAEQREEGPGRARRPGDRRGAAARRSGGARPGRDLGPLARWRDSRRWPHSGRHLDRERRPRPSSGEHSSAAVGPARRDIGGARRRRLPVRRRRRGAPAGRHHPRHPRDACDGRPSAGAELGSGRRGLGRGGVRRRRLHGHELAEHDRPLASRAAGSRRRPSPRRAPLRRRRGGRRADRDRRRLDPGGNSQRRGALLRPRDRPRHARRAPAQPDHARGRRRARQATCT